jgi:hypothetical protein
MSGPRSPCGCSVWSCRLRPGGGRQTAARRHTAHRDPAEREARGALHTAVPRRRDAGELESTPLIQASDPTHPRRSRSGSLPARRTRHDVARRSDDWVYGTLRKDVTLSVPSALQVLDAAGRLQRAHGAVRRAGACARPARADGGRTGAHPRPFYYHAWPEVWLGEWVAVDPTLGQYPADASHLRFLVGGLAVRSN